MAGIDFTKNVKQEELVSESLRACDGKSIIREIFYGGAIRGGKTFGCLGVLSFLCLVYPKSKWVVYRQDFPALQDTSIPSMEKILGNTNKWKWNRDKSNYHCTHIRTGSTIYFYGVNITQDPELNSILGLEVNGVLLEQIEEIPEIFYKKIKSRLGSWYIDKMPKPLLLATVNPTQNYIKKVVYEPWRSGSLPEHIHFIQALPSDNPFITDEQKALWDRLDDKTKRQYIDGDWTDLTDKDSLFAWAFDRGKHLPKFIDTEIWEGNKNHYLWLSFDFNRNPICCSVIQNYNDIIYVIETIKLKNSNIYALCDHIKVKYAGFLYLITGDATGQSSSAMVQDNINYYTIIMRSLTVSGGQLRLSKVNPKIADNQVLVNSLLQRSNVLIHPTKAEGLIYDLENVKMLPDGTIEKRDRNDPAQQADCLDTFRYYCNTNHINFVNRII